MQERFETFTVLINRISRSIRRIKNREMAEYGLRSTHVSCLYYLYGTDSVTATDLCEKCGEDKATISRALEYLEKNGYLTCEARRAKRYKSPLVLTEKGAEAARRIAEKIDLVLAEISAGMTEAERTEFYRCLAIVSNGLEAIGTRSDETDPAERIPGTQHL